VAAVETACGLVETRSVIPALHRAESRWLGDGIDIVRSKLRIPELAPMSVHRTGLVNRLRAARTFPLVLVVAPAGYGKSTLLAQWMSREARPSAWLSLDERDNDPAVLLKHLAAAMDPIVPLARRVTRALRGGSESVWDAAVPRLTAELSSLTSPFVLVLDDADLLDSDESAAVLGSLVENIPHGSTIVLSGRATPNLQVAALRVGGSLFEIGAEELAFARREAELLLRSFEVELDEDELHTLLERTDGWATGIFLAALELHERDDDRPFELAEFAGDDRYVADYFRSQYLSRMTPDLLQFLRRTSVLEKMCGSLCDSLLETTDSAFRLQTIEDANLFIVPLDRTRLWFRYHPLFRSLLRTELERLEPGLTQILHERAADWYEAHSDPESALGHAQAMDDTARAARILTSIACQTGDCGRIAAFEERLEYFDQEERLERYPSVAAVGAGVHALLGRPQEATRWLAAAERGASAGRRGAPAARPWIAAQRAAMCPSGPERMQVDARSALAKLKKDDRWRPAALITYGVAALLLGDDESAESSMVEAAEESERLGCTDTLALALAERSLLATANDDPRRADTLAIEAWGLVETEGLDGDAMSSLAVAVSARALLRQGQWDRARQRLTRAERLSTHVTYAIPWLAVQTRLEIGHAYVTLRDRKGAFRIMEGIREIIDQRPGLGGLVPAFEEYISTVAALPTDRPSGGLTAAELRLLPILGTHLTFHDIGTRLHLSRNTVKTQAISIYRKLGVANRSDAIGRAAELGLIGPDVAEPHPVEATSISIHTPRSAGILVAS
jgi:LuxR family maltose regulon positive regulatory protein